MHSSEGVLLCNMHVRLAQDKFQISVCLLDSDLEDPQNSLVSFPAS